MQNNNESHDFEVIIQWDGEEQQTVWFTSLNFEDFDETENTYFFHGMTRDDVRKHIGGDDISLNCQVLAIVDDEETQTPSNLVKIASHLQVIGAVNLLYRAVSKYSELPDPDVYAVRAVRLLADGAAYVKYQFFKDDDKIAMLHNDEETQFTESEFKSFWDKQLSDGMYFVPPEDDARIDTLCERSIWGGEGIRSDVHPLLYLALTDGNMELEDITSNALLFRDVEVVDTPFTESETTTLFEVARYALGDANMFDKVGSDMDIDGSTLKALKEKLENHMEGVRT